MEAVRSIFELVKSKWMSEDKWKSLKRKMGELTAIKTDINIQLEKAESSFGKRRKSEVTNWLVQVEKIEDEFWKLEAGMRETRWSKIWGGRVQTLSEDVGELIGKSKFQGGLRLEVFENIREPLLVNKLAGAAFQKNLEKIWVGLMNDENFSVIGIYGMGGVGKTTLVTHVYNQLLKKPNMFPNVYWITVSQDFSIRKMQRHVARVICLSLEDEDEENKRAAKLSRALAGKQQFVFILDDLWNPFSIEEVGIPVDRSRCKLILTTRSLDVCRMMCCQEKIKLEPLGEEESWNLFVEKLGNYSTLSTEVQKIADSVARECDGLPLGIVTMAGSMRGVDNISEWRNVLEELKESNGGQSEMEDKVFQILKYSYARLKDPILQQCFLFCALFPEDYSIKRKVLIDYLIFEGQIKGLKTRMSQMDKGHTLLNKLENVCLLESCIDGDNDRCVRMHDLIRDMALNIMKESSKAIVQAGKHLTKFPAEIEWMEDLKRVSLMHNRMRKIPLSHSPRCPNLSTLLICHNPPLSNIADSFFVLLCGLKILDLSYTGITVLPSSVSNLVHLTCLLLNNCRLLRRIPSLAKLKTLEKLDLSDTRIEVLPQELEFLSKLGYHDMKDIRFQEDRPFVVVLKFFHLQYFSLDRSLVIEGELGSLSELEYLSCSFYDAHDFYGYFCCGLQKLNEDQRKLLNKYSLMIGKWDKFNCYRKYLEGLSKTVFFCKCDIGKEGQFVAIPKDLEGLVIDNCHDARSLCNVSLLENCTSLELLDISRCRSFECLACFSSSSNIIDCIKTLILEELENLQVLIINRDGIPPPFLSSRAFSCLKRLDIWHCPSLKSLFPWELLPNLQNLEEVKVRRCDGLEAIIPQNGGEGDAILPFIHGGAFSCLKRFQIEFCPCIKSLFPYQLLPNLHKLTEIIVLYCGKMEQLVASKSEEEVIMGDHSEFSLPKLRLLNLKQLPKLRSICSENLICDSIQYICLWHCPKLRRITLSLIQLDNEQRPCPLPCLTKIEVFPKELWNSIDWGHPDAKDVLQSLFAEEVSYENSCKETSKNGGLP